MDNLELVKQNSAEIINEENIPKILKKKKPIVYCGYETSGEIHLGHLVTITKLIDLAKAGFHVKVLFADWHTFLNQKGDWDFIEKQVKNSGLTIIPLLLFTTDKGLAKVEIAICKGKKLFDKRESIKDRDNQRDLSRIKKNFNK